MQEVQEMQERPLRGDGWSAPPISQSANQPISCLGIQWREAQRSWRRRMAS